MTNCHNLVNKSINTFSKDLCFFNNNSTNLKIFLEFSMAVNMAVRSIPCKTGSSQDYLLLSWPNVVTVAPPSAIGPLCSIRPRKHSSILVATTNDWLWYLILIFQCRVGHFELIHFCSHKHWWPLPISTCCNLTHPSESQYHQNWSFFVVPSISVSLAKSPEIVFAARFEIHYWCAESFSISFGNTVLAYQTRQVEA